jgi:hypothetical protein
MVSRHSPEDFLVRFFTREDLDYVLHAPVLIGTSFFLDWKHWRWQSMAEAVSMCYKVLLGISGVPAHNWGISAAERILGTSCSKLVEAPATAAADDLWEYQAVAWCIHQNFIPLEKVIVVPEPELPVTEPPLYIREHEVMHS